MTAAVVVMFYIFIFGENWPIRPRCEMLVVWLAHSLMSKYPAEDNHTIKDGEGCLSGGGGEAR